MKELTICVTGGTVTDLGKTTISKNLKTWILNSGLGDDVKAVHIGVETKARQADMEDDRIGSTQAEIKDVHKLMRSPRNVVILDVGGDNFKAFIETANELDGIVEKVFSHVIVPVTDAVKPDVVCAGIQTLVGNGVDPANIYVVYNRVMPSKVATLASDYASVTRLSEEIGFNIAKTPILKNTVITRLLGVSDVYGKAGQTEQLDRMIDEAYADGNDELAERYIDDQTDSAQADLAAENYNQVFDEIFGDVVGRIKAKKAALV